jgi:hypothetical protein
LWRTLNDAHLVHLIETSSSESPRWSYRIPYSATRLTHPLLPAQAALSKLQSSVADAVTARPTHRFQHTLQALTDFTGYLTKIYALASTMRRSPNTTPSPAMRIEEEEIRMQGAQGASCHLLRKHHYDADVPWPPSKTSCLFLQILLIILRLLEANNAPFHPPPMDCIERRRSCHWSDCHFDLSRYAPLFCSSFP